MADKYRNYGELENVEEYGVDYRFWQQNRRSVAVIVAPHGGTIERGTSELAIAIAGQEHSLYLFEGLKPPRRAWALHISSHRFDAPGCRELIEHSQFAVGIHGERQCKLPVAFLGGLDCDLMNAAGDALLSRGFDVRLHPDPDLQGLHKKNICNIGANKAGLQFEISRPLRRLFFASLTVQGRQYCTPLFYDFVRAVRSCL